MSDKSFHEENLKIVKDYLLLSNYLENFITKHIMERILKLKTSRFRNNLNPWNTKMTEFRPKQVFWMGNYKELTKKEDSIKATSQNPIQNQFKRPK